VLSFIFVWKWVEDTKGKHVEYMHREAHHQAHPAAH
jgi:SP family sugar:H+ symporter-like MFS transporter